MNTQTTPTAGAMRAAQLIHDIALGWEIRGPIRHVAELIDRETGVSELVECLERATNALDSLEWHTYGSGSDLWSACPACSAMEGSPHGSGCDLNTAIQRGRAALAKTKGAQ